MKIISLNTYMGHVFEPLMDFFEKEASTTDVFCLQEILSSESTSMTHEAGKQRVNLLQEITERLPDHEVVFDPTQEDFEINPDQDGSSQLGSAIFYRRALTMRETGSFFICNTYNSFVPKDYATLAHNAMYIVVEHGDERLLICGLHGNSQPPNKLDSPFRLAQFEKVKDFLTKREEQIILMGDFNAMPETQSVKMFEQLGLRNLIQDFGIKTTRGSMMRKLFPHYEHGPYGFQEYADYTFVSPEIEIVSFEVPDLPTSDHLPMILTIN